MYCDHELKKFNTKRFKGKNFKCAKCKKVFRQVFKNIFAQRVRGL